MIGFECPWCDQRLTLQPDALAAGSITCPACLTQVDLAVSPVAGGPPVRSHGMDTELPLAA
jgi:hypothetical protein